MAEQSPQSAQSANPARSASTARWGRGRIALLAIAAVVAVVVAIAGIDWIVYRFTHSVTDDAFVESHLVSVAPQVPGHIAQTLVQENDPLGRDQLIVRIDPAPYLRKVELAQADLTVTEAEHARQQAALYLLVEAVPKRISIAQHNLDIALETEEKNRKVLELTGRDVQEQINDATAALAAARAVQVQTEQDFKRFEYLSQRQTSSVRRFEEATRAFRTAQADVDSSRAKLAQAQAARSRIDIAERELAASTLEVERARQTLRVAELGELEVAEAQRLVTVMADKVEQSRRALQLAETNLRYTQIVAPFNSVVAKRFRFLGDWVDSGTPVASVYNPELKFVTAHLSETKLSGVSPGNEVRLDVDAFDRPFRGRVVWIGPATGSNFALVPRDISSGEFTKVVQRLPVRIWIERDERWTQLRPGMSVTVSIEHGPGDPQWAQEATDAMRKLETGSLTPVDDLPLP